MHYAVSCHGGNIDATYLLLDVGGEIEVFAAGQASATPLELAILTLRNCYCTKVPAKMLVIAMVLPLSIAQLGLEMIIPDDVQCGGCGCSGKQEWF